MGELGEARPFLAAEVAVITAPRLAFTSHARYNACTMWQLGKEFLLFLKQEKKWWLIPLVLLLLILGALIAFTGGSVLAPLMYPVL